MTKAEHVFEKIALNYETLYDAAQRANSMYDDPLRALKFARHAVEFGQGPLRPDTQVYRTLRDATFGDYTAQRLSGKTLKDLQADAIMMTGGSSRDERWRQLGLQTPLSRPNPGRPLDLRIDEESKLNLIKHLEADGTLGMTNRQLYDRRLFLKSLKNSDNI